MPNNKIIPLQIDEPGLLKNDDNHGVWYSPNKFNGSSAYKLIDEVLFESGNMMAYSSEYESDEVSWSPVVSFESEYIRDIVSNKINIDLSNTIITKNEELISFLKKEKGYAFDRHSSEFVKVNDLASFCENLYQDYFKEHGFLDGGCASLALAIKKSLPSSVLRGCYGKDGLLEHVFVGYNGLYLDGNGIFENGDSILKAFNEQSFKKVVYAKQTNMIEIGKRDIPIYLDKIPIIAIDLINHGVIKDILNKSEMALDLSVSQMMR